MRYELTQPDAMIVAVASTEAFSELNWDRLTLEERRGAVLLYERLMSRAEPLLPQTPEMQYVHDAVTKLKLLGRTLRETQAERAACTCLSISRDPICAYHGDADKVRTS